LDFVNLFIGSVNGGHTFPGINCEMNKHHTEYSHHS